MSDRKRLWKHKSKLFARGRIKKSSGWGVSELTLGERVGMFVRGKYYDWWACPRGHHYMKFSGCIYCGAQVKGSGEWGS